MRLVLHPKVSSSAITIDIHLLDPGVDRSMAELEECPWSGLGFQWGHQVVGVEILNLSKRFGKMSKRWLCLADELTTACKSD